MLALSLGAWCVVLALLALATAVGGMPNAAMELAYWTEAALVVLLAAGVLTLVANLPPLRRLWPVRSRRFPVGASSSLGEL